MNKEQRKKRVRVLEDLVNAQQELIMVYSEVMDVIDAADHAVATTVDPYNETVIGKDLQEVRALHIDREEELVYEIAKYFDVIEGKDKKPTDDNDSNI